MKGYRESRNEILQSYENFETQERRMRSEPRQGSSSGVRASRLTAGVTSQEQGWDGLSRGRSLSLVWWTEG